MNLKYREKKILKILLVVALIILANVLTHTLYNRYQMKKHGMILVPKDEVLNYFDTQFDYLKFVDVEFNLERLYVDDFDIENFKEGQIRGMVKGADYYGEYFDKKAYHEYIEDNREDKHPDNIATSVKDGVGYITISKFYDGSHEEFNRKLNELINQNLKGIVVDFRNTEAGDRESTVAVGSRFVDDKLFITMNKDKEEEIVKSNGDIIDKPFVVLINENTKGSSELIAAAIKDYGTGKLVGNISYGEGYFQEFYELSDESMIYLSNYKNKSPLGKSITDKGVEPDILLVDKKYPENIGIDFLEDDIQLKKAFEILK